jgi:putative ABC transport system permease protein
MLLALLITMVFRMIVGVEVYPSLSLSTVVLAIGSSSIVGLVFGTVPARRAANLPPVLAIAHE